MHSFSGKATRRNFLGLAGAFAGAQLCPYLQAETTKIAPQPYFAGVNRALEALAKLGSPVAATDVETIAALARQGDSAAVDAAERIVNLYTLASVVIEPDRSLRVSVGGAQRSMVEQGWRLFLIRVANPRGRVANLSVTTTVKSGLAQYGTMTPGHMSWNQEGELNLAQRSNILNTLNDAPLIEAMWVMSKLADASLLSGTEIEYRVLELFSRDRGQHRADFNFEVFSNVDDSMRWYAKRELDFECLPSRDVVLGVLDTDGRSCVASLTIKDKSNRVYPPQVMRLAPDMPFHPQVYRSDRESVRLPDGEYTIESRRGPEYLRTLQTMTVDGNHNRIDVKLERWIDPAKWGWYSGDTHIHAGGCLHYQVPTEGVSPETIIRHVRGEGLSIGDVLTWGPSWYYQKQFFTARAQSPAASLEHPDLQTANNASLQPHPTAKDSESVLRYDVEVSGFPSSHCGHLVLLRLQKQDYPGTKLIEEWPSWNLPILKWAAQQGALGGYAHCGNGMVVDSADLPNYEIPPMDGIGTQEAIIDVTHGVCDFLSGVDTHPLAELNAWYHMLNCGFRMSMVGETDWPCITGDRVGTGRSYVRLDHRPVGDSGYEAWVRGLKQGRVYCGDGRSHFLDFKVNGLTSGETDLAMERPATLQIEALVVARLEPAITPETTPKRILPGWGWHLEWGRIGTTREASVELVVNGVAVEKKPLVADGTPRAVNFRTSIMRSSWVALRIMPSAHTHPIFAQVGGRPIRASKRSALWCRACVDKVWKVKSPFMRNSERPVAAEAFDHARKVYEAIASECEVA